MPLPSLPLTPASSTDLKGKDGYHLSSLEPSFSLPPPAITSRSQTRSCEASSKPGSSPQTADASMSPPTMSVRKNQSRRRTSTAGSTATKDEFTLPPPPTRARKIIQMKPPSLSTPGKDTSSGVAKATSGSSPAEMSGKKRKQPSASSAAGRKIARKTAHSLIERRRRSKMNEEFGILKQMIPACRDQEMHKLAILQASIEYMRYLEQCVSDLEANAVAPHDPDYTLRDQPSPSNLVAAKADEHGMEDMPLAKLRPRKDHGHDDGITDSQSLSPALEGRNYTMPSTTSSLVTPTFPPRTYSVSSYNSLSTSPVTAPQPAGDRDIDHEVSEALLLLNSGRRGSSSHGMSVKDLLSA